MDKLKKIKKMSFWLLVLLLLTLSFWSIGFSRQATAQSPQIDPPLRQVWETTFPGEGSVQAILTEGGAVYTLTAEGIVRALSAPDGQLLWETSGWLAPEARRCPYDPPKMQSLSDWTPYPQPGILLALDGGQVVAALCAGWEGFVTDQQLLLLDRATGQIQRTLPVIGGRLMSVHEGVAVISAQDGLYGLRLADGQEVWRIAAEDKYNFYIQAALEGLAFVQIYNQNNQPVVTAVSTGDGAQLWTLPPGGNWYFKALTGDTLFAFYEDMSANQQMMLALEPQTGNEMWRIDLSQLGQLSPSYMKIFLHDGVIYVYNRDNYMQTMGIAAFDLGAGQLLWSSLSDLSVRDVQVLGEHIYCVGRTDSDTSLYALSLVDGQLVWSGLSGDNLGLGLVSQGQAGPIEDILFVTGSQPGVLGNDTLLAAYQGR